MIIYPTPESLEHHPVVPRDQWLVARTELLKEEKEFTRLRDKINAQRRDLPGFASRRTTPSKARTARKRWPISSRAVASCW
jgi:predicted dithiol-disulfide oxidoreductase (DUF899 family)